MDRRSAYRDEVIYETDALLAQRYAYEGLGRFMRDVLGSATVFGGLACTPTSPASLAVRVGPGAIYNFGALEPTDWAKRLGTGGLDLDTASDHQIMRQGLYRDTTVFNTPAPGTGGQSIIYLIQAAFLQADEAPTSSEFYNPASPGSPISADVSHTRQDRCVVSIKASAASASPTAPSADAGNIPLWRVTVANGSSGVTAGNITADPGAPVISIGGGGGGGGGTGLAAWQKLNANHTCVAGERLIGDTSGGVITFTLPAAPAFGDEIWVAGNAGTNKITIGRNSKTISGDAANFDINVDDAGAHFVYQGGNDWLVFRG